MNAFLNGFFNASLYLGQWALRHPRQYVMVALPFSILSWYVGAQFGSWDVLGVLKFFGSTVLFGMFVGTPVLFFTAWLSQPKVPF